jgi:hypothetical protein
MKNDERKTRAAKPKAKRQPLSDLKPTRSDAAKGGAPRRNDPYKNFNFRVE